MSIDREHLLDLIRRASTDRRPPVEAPGSDFVGEATAEFEDAGFEVEREVPWAAIAMRAGELRDAEEARDGEE